MNDARSLLDDNYISCGEFLLQGVSTGDNTDSHIQQNGEKSVALDMTVPHGTCKEENRNMVHPGENEKDVSSSKQSLLSKKVHKIIIL